MNVDVIWWTHDVGGMCRFFADQGFLEAALARDLWTPPDPITFVHHEIAGAPFPDVPGAVVVIPARHNADPESTAWFVRELDRLDWSVVVLAGDEGVELDFTLIPETATRRVWAMQPSQCHESLSGRIPGGWYPGTREGVRDASRASVRTLDWFFGGQVTHQRRQECAHELRAIPGGLLHETDRYYDTSGMDQATYWQHLASAKVIPCPSGPLTVDTARAFEAMEAGCVPILDIVTPDREPWDYWTFLFRDENFPAPRIIDWSTLPDVIRCHAGGWPGTANRTWAAWMQYKRRITRQLDSDIRAVSNQPAALTTPDDLITVIVTTSPIPSHPSTAIIEETVQSIRDQLPRAEIVIAVDGVRPEQDHDGQTYADYVHQLLWLTNFEWHNVVPVILEEWGHQANAVRAALALVESPLILFVEHDTPLVGDIPWPALCEVVTSGEANCVRFHHEVEVHPDQRAVMLDDNPIDVETSHGPVPLRRTAAWWQRPHLASAGFYRRQIIDPIPESARSMVEEPSYHRLWVDYCDAGFVGWDQWRVFIYQPDGNMKRSTHLDGRAGTEKYAMWWT